MKSWRNSSWSAIFRKGAGLLCAEAELKFAFTDRHKNEYAVEEMSRVLQVAKSGYYAWRARPIRLQQTANDELMQAIREVHDGSKQRDGSYKLMFRGLLERLFVERMDQNEAIFVRYMNDLSFRDVVSAWMAAEVYRRMQAGGNQAFAIAPRNSLQARPG